VQIDGRPAFVVVCERQPDGVIDVRDGWALAREQKAARAGEPRELDRHQWLDGRAFRPLRFDPHGRSIALVPFDPGISEAAEQARDDPDADDRKAERAAHPLAFGHDLAAALAAAKGKQQRVLVIVGSPASAPSKFMDEFVLPSAAVAAAGKGVVAVRIDGDQQREQKQRLRVETYPTLLLLDADGKELRRTVGYLHVAAVVTLLRP